MTMLCSLELERDHYTLGELLRGYVVLRAETGADLASIIMRVFAYERTYLARVGTLSCDAPARQRSINLIARLTRLASRLGPAQWKKTPNE